MGSRTGADKWFHKFLRVIQQLAVPEDEVKMEGLLPLALLVRGHALVGLQRQTEAGDAYGQALVLCHTLSNTHFAVEAQAGLAQIALVQGNLVLAQRHVEEILLILVDHPSVRLDEPFFLISPVIASWWPPTIPTLAPFCRQPMPCCKATLRTFTTRSYVIHSCRMSLFIINLW